MVRDRIARQDNSPACAWGSTQEETGLMKIENVGTFLSKIDCKRDSITIQPESLFVSIYDES
jgi:hypothetical protein